MEAIKPGSTLNQWVRPHLRAPTVIMQTPPPRSPGHAPTGSSKDGTGPDEVPPPIPSRSRAKTVGGQLENKSTNYPRNKVEKLAPPAPNVPPRPDFTTQSSDCTYVPAHLLNMPTNPEQETTDEKDSKEPHYIPLIAATDEEGKSLAAKLQQEEETIKELNNQLSPTQVDLLIQMFKTWLTPQQQQQLQQQQQQQQQQREEGPSRRISLPSRHRSNTTASLSVSDAPEPTTPIAR